MPWQKVPLWHPSGSRRCYKVSPEPSLLQAKQPHLFQHLLIEMMLLLTHHPCGPPLDLLQQVPVLLSEAPELDAVFQVRLFLHSV